MIQNKITGEVLRDMILSAALILEKNKEALNELNVFPVPDGDTGTNMTLTMMSAAKEVKGADASSVDKIAQALSMGALRGARGNSGVILSQIFRGFAQALSGVSAEVSPEHLVRAMELGVESAYKAVMKPKEGTILTVARSMAEAARKTVSTSKDVLDIINTSISDGEKTLAKTPDMLPVLKEAGVVDAGGKGLIIIFTGFKMAITGEESDIDFESIAASKPTATSEVSSGNIEFGYCTEFFIKNLHKGVALADVDNFRELLSKIGDCVLVVGDLSLVKTHVHTNAPGKALNLAMKLGELSGIKIDNMREQHNEIIGSTIEQAAAAGPKDVEPQKDLAIVSIAAGEGVCNILKELGVDRMVEGGQTMNPSADDIAAAAESAPSNNVIILPNNKNIILAAEQSASLTHKNIMVVPSKSIPQGINALIAFNPEAGTEENVKRMKEAIDKVKTGSITKAVRDSKVNGNTIKEGDYIGISDTDIVFNDKDLSRSVDGLLKSIVDDNDCVITAFYGEDITEDQAEEERKRIAAAYPNCDVEMQNGGQPVYHYIFAVE